MILSQLSSMPPYKTFTYIIGCKNSLEGAVIDPSADVDSIIDEINSTGVNLKYIINTHNHPDHTVDNYKLKQATKAKIIQHKNSSAGDVKITDKEIISLGDLELHFFHTPGHTDHDICIKVGKELFTGDTLFVGKVGGTKDKNCAKTQFESLKRLMELPEDVKVWPGHDNGFYQSSTIGYEKNNNPFCLRLHDFDEFYYLKENWQDFKEKHGLI